MADDLEDPLLRTSVVRRIDRQCDEFESAWKSGQVPRIEDYVADRTDAESNHLFRELLKIDVACRMRMPGGFAATEQVYRRRFPQHAHEITVVFQGVTRQTGMGDATSTESPAIILPRQIGRYELQQRIGRGGMGDVYRALHIPLNRTVALKLISARQIGDPLAVSRFSREMQAVGKLKHPNVVNATDAGEIDGTHYLAMELVEGMDLARIVRRLGRLPIDDACEIIRQAALGMVHAHQMGLIHRDLKPSNLMLDKQGVIKVLDMGLARLFEPGQNSEELSALTAVAEIVGTPAYMAPEQARDIRLIDERVDIYSLGCSLYEFLTGQPPFPKSKYPNPFNLLMAHLNDPLPSMSVSRPELPKPLIDVVEQMLARQPTERMASMSDVTVKLSPFVRTCDLGNLLGRALQCPLGDPRDSDSFVSNVEFMEVPPHEPSPEVHDDAVLQEDDVVIQQRRKYATVGIDLGTTYSALAYIDVHGDPQVVANPDDQSNVTASVVYIDGDDIVVGATALRNAKSAPENVVQFAKRDMGEQNARYVRGDDRKTYTPESISAIILKKLVAYSEQEIGPIRRAVVTVPAFFNGLRRVATAQAGQIAGLEVVATLNEPSAACIAYRLHTNEQMGTYVVYDLGGGTFDVTVMRVGQNRIQELVSDGNRQLGGYDWDQKLVDMVCRQFLDQHHLDPRTDRLALQSLMNDCCEAKKTLSSLKKAHIRCTFQGRELRAEITRDDFERETAGLLKKTELTIEGCLKSAGASWADLAGPDDLDAHQRESLRKHGFGWDDIDGIMLVGGSTRMPMVQSMIKRISGKEPMRNVDVDLAVALGAAIYAGVLETESSNLKFEERKTFIPLTDVPPTPVRANQAFLPGFTDDFEYATVNSLGIGIFVSRVGEPMNFVMIPPRTVLPATKSHTFRTTQDNATNVRVRISEGDSTNPDQCHELGFCVVGPLPERLPRGSKIEIQIGFDKDGRVTVQGRCVTTNTVVHAVIDAAGLLTQEQVDHERRDLDRRAIN